MNEKQIKHMEELARKCAAKKCSDSRFCDHPGIGTVSFESYIESFTACHEHAEKMREALEFYANAKELRIRTNKSCEEVAEQTIIEGTGVRYVESNNSKAKQALADWSNPKEQEK